MVEATEVVRGQRTESSRHGPTTPWRSHQPGRRVSSSRDEGGDTGRAMRMMRLLGVRLGFAGEFPSWFSWVVICDWRFEISVGYGAWRDFWFNRSGPSSGVATLCALCLCG